MGKDLYIIIFHGISRVMHYFLDVIPLECINVGLTLILKSGPVSIC